MAEKVALDKAWAEAARRCRLSPADMRMAKELGFKPRSLLENQPSPQTLGRRPSRSGSATCMPNANAAASSGASDANARRRQWWT